MRVGSAILHPIIEFEALEFPPETFLEDYKPADLDPHADWLCPHHFNPQAGTCILSQHAWLIEVDGARILVDPCVGDQRNRPETPWYHRQHSPMLERLEAMGAPPESIDIVFCTHLHLDHVGWNTRLSDGRWVPTFPNARYIFSPVENEYWRRDLNGELLEWEKFNVGVYAECVLPVIEAGLADMAGPGARIGGCITLLDAAGHTAGHMAGVLESLGQGVVLAGDAIHHPLQVLYPDRPVAATDPVAAHATRHRLLTLCAEKDYWLAPGHFRAPHVCKVRRTGEGYVMDWPESLPA